MPSKILPPLFPMIFLTKYISFLSRPKLNLDTIWPLNSLFSLQNQRNLPFWFTFQDLTDSAIPFPGIFCCCLVIGKKNEGSYLSCVTNGEFHFSKKNVQHFYNFYKSILKLCRVLRFGNHDRLPDTVDCQKYYTCTRGENLLFFNFFKNPKSFF